MTTEQRLNDIDSRLDRLVQVTERQAENIEALVSGMAQLIETTVEFRSDLFELKELTQQQGELIKQQGDRIDRIAQTFESQAETTARLVRIVEQLLNRNE
jgi:methyl-accepting chemotaxis protein